jgi:glucuronate isomerase
MDLTDFIFHPEKLMAKLLKGNNLSGDETEKFRCAVMLELCRMNHKRGWVQQFHVGAMRNNNARMFRAMGPDTGWDSIGVAQDALKMSKFLSSLDDSNELAGLSCTTSILQIMR